MQDLLAILIALSAAGYLARRAWQRLVHRRAGACGGCSNCGSAESQNVVRTEQLTIHR